MDTCVSSSVAKAPPVRNPEAAPVVIIGAGPAGLTAAYELAKHGVRSTVLELDSVAGGNARTVEYRGHRFDPGGRPFSPGSRLVERISKEILGEELIERPRLSRIYRNSKFFQFPRESNLFDKRLFRTFLESYAEKIWGRPVQGIHPEWLMHNCGGTVRYPRLGSGQIWNRAKELVEERGCHVLLQTSVDRVFWEPGRVFAVLARGRLYQAGQFISTMPVRELIAKLDPQPPPWVLRTVDDFHYRDAMTVALVVRDRNLFPDHRILIHDSNVKVAHIQNFNLSPDMAPNHGTSPLLLGYVCNEGDSLWSMRDRDLVRFAAGELAQLGLARGEDVLDGTVVRMPKAYPLWDATCARAIDALRRFLRQIPNLQLAGRNGMHRDGSPDHSMLTAVLAARNILNGLAGLATRYDLWRVNAPEDQRDFPAPLSNAVTAPLIILEPRGVESRPAEVHEFERTSLVRRLR